MRISDWSSDVCSSDLAQLNHLGITDSRYSSRSARDAWALSYNEDAIWEGIARARALDKNAFSDIPDTPEDYRRALTAPVDAKMAQERYGALLAHHQIGRAHV